MEERCDGNRHARLIESILYGGNGGSVGVQQVVRRSWMRCVANYALDPAHPKQPAIVERRDLRVRRERLGQLYPIARTEMLALYRQIDRADVGIVLTDRDGVIISYAGHAGFTEIANGCGLREGAVWSESEQGTNGMGTCLSERQPTIIHRSDHFFPQNTLLTCVAAPIFDARGEVAAVLDISGRADHMATLTLALVNLTAQTIENRALLAGGQQQRMLRFHKRSDVICTPGEGVIVLDEEGTVAGANRSALKLLGYARHSEMCGRPFEQVFNTTADRLAEVERSSGSAYVPVWSGQRHRFYATMQRPAVISSHSGETPAKSHGSALLDDMDYGDPVMARGLRVVRRVLDCDLPILLLGETGTGKGYLAKAVHQASSRRDGPFVTVNCAAIPESLIESELFGYKAGAFTGAARDGHAGRILQANGGTLFLDEIGDMPLPLQVRLLSVIEDQEVLPLGGSEPIPVDVRIVSATHRNLVERVGEGLFRDDLYYRINGITVTLPPLRERADSQVLIRRLLEVEGGGDLDIDQSVIERLATLSWPGNLRQLRNVLRAMIALSDQGRLTVDDIPPELFQDVRAPRENAASQAQMASGSDVLDQAEREAIRDVMDACGWKMIKAADQLGVSRKTLYRKLRKHGLTRPQVTSRSNATR